MLSREQREVVPRWSKTFTFQHASVMLNDCSFERAPGAAVDTFREFGTLLIPAVPSPTTHRLSRLATRVPNQKGWFNDASRNTYEFLGILIKQRLTGIDLCGDLTCRGRRL